MMCGQEEVWVWYSQDAARSSRIYLLFGRERTNVTFRDSADHLGVGSDSKIHAEGGCKGPLHAMMSTECRARKRWQSSLVTALSLHTASQKDIFVATRNG